MLQGIFRKQGAYLTTGAHRSKLAPAVVGVPQVDPLPFGRLPGTIVPILFGSTHWQPPTGTIASYTVLSQSVAAKPFGSTIYPKPVFITGRGIGRGPAPNLTTYGNQGTALGTGECGSKAISPTNNNAALAALVGGQVGP